MNGPLVLSYYVVLRTVLRLKSWLRKCLARCRHCGIFFLTHARNAGRGDLRCPFGCRNAHRRQESTRRSVDYYRQPEGKTKKRELNARRRKTGASVPPPQAPSAPSPPPEPPPPWPRAILNYVCLAVSLIEGRKVYLNEVVEMLRRTLRQHRMVRTRRIDQGVASLHERPP